MQNVSFPNLGTNSFTIENDLQNVNFTGERASLTISGKVTKKAGGDIQSLSLDLMQGETKVATIKTDKTGAYQFTDLKHNSAYTVKASDPSTKLSPDSRNAPLSNCSVSNSDFTAQ